MKTFQEWLEEKHPESVDESLRKTLGALTLAGASLLGGSDVAKAIEPAIKARQAVSQQITESQQKRLNVMKGVSKVHRFKQNWGTEFGPKEEKQLFDIILNLKTDHDHDELIDKISSDMKETLRIQMQGKSHPDKDINRSEIRQIQNSYQYQYMDYIKALTLASKLNL